MVIANNAISLKKKNQSAVIEDNNVFVNIESVSIATIDRVLSEIKCAWNNCTKCHFEGNNEMQRVDLPLQEILSLLHCKGWYTLWCRWKCVAKQTGTSGCARMIYLFSVTIHTVMLFTFVHSSTKSESESALLAKYTYVYKEFDSGRC